MRASCFSLDCLTTPDRWAHVARTLSAVTLTVALGTFGGGAAFTGKAHAEPLHAALAAAYRNNPRLDAERARVRAVDEQVPQARAGWKPQISGEVTTGVIDRETSPQSTDAGTNYRQSYGVNVSQSLFDGFQTRYRLHAAEAQVRSAQQELRQVEAAVLLEAATAYLDVVRDRALVKLARKNVSFLKQELRAARARLDVREVTKTDVAQAQARLARAQSDLDAVLADLAASEADYLRVIGKRAKSVRMPPLKLKRVPKSLGAALSGGEQESPVVLAALYREQSSRAQVSQVRGELLPNARVEASYNSTLNSLGNISRDNTASLVGRLTVPLYSGGATRSRVREAKHTHVERIQQVTQAKTEVAARIRAAWARLRAAKAQIKSDMVQIRANRVALTGVRNEEEVGQRTLLDVLDAQQELLNSQAQLVRSRRDAVVAQFTLLGEIGRLDASTLKLAAEIYDPDVHYHEARHLVWTTSIAGERDLLDLGIDERRLRNRATSEPEIERPAWDPKVVAARRDVEVPLRGSASVKDRLRPDYVTGSIKGEATSAPKRATDRTDTGVPTREPDLRSSLDGKGAPVPWLRLMPRID